MAAASDHHAARPVFQSAGVLIADSRALVGGVSDVVMYARDPVLEGTFDERRYARASTLARPGSASHSTTVRPWSSTRRGREFVS